MKSFNFILLLTIVLFSLTSMSQTTKMATVQGTISTKKIPTEITLFAVVNGVTVLHSTSAVAKDGSFGFFFSPQYNGFYTLGDAKSSVRIYAAPGKQISIAITDEGLTNLNPDDQENSQLAAWDKVIYPLKRLNVMGTFTYKDIFPILPEVEKAKDVFIKTVKTKNVPFNNLMKGLARAEFEYQMYHSVSLPRTIHPTFDQYPPIFKQYSSGVHFATADVLNYEFGIMAVMAYVSYLASAKRNEGVKVDADVMASLCAENVKNDTLKGYFLLSTYLMGAKTYDQAYKDKLEKYRKYVVTESQKAALDAFILKIKGYSEGVKAMDFWGNTVDGKKVTLADLKGKVVVVDVWATWCVPCKKEIPFLTKLEEEMQGKNVTFVSYSIDDIKDHDKWAKFIVSEKLGGLQLIGEAAGKSNISVSYKISTIPRFMVFSKEGNIVNIDAPRPSTPELKALIEKFL